MRIVEMKKQTKPKIPPKQKKKKKKEREKKNQIQKRKRKIWTRIV
jgi:hypothetical protein